MPHANPRLPGFDLDFDEAANLARVDPVAFEKHRRAIIDSFIANAPEGRRHRLRCLQWRIDMERDRAPNSLAACVRIYSMMWDSFAGESGLVAAIRNPGCFLSRTERTAETTVLAFPESSAKDVPPSNR
jgi:hypothetical protein